jgi:hypothetical protein
MRPAQRRPVRAMAGIVLAALMVAAVIVVLV